MIEVKKIPKSGQFATIHIHRGEIFGFTWRKTGNLIETLTGEPNNEDWTSEDIDFNYVLEQPHKIFILEDVFEYGEEVWIATSDPHFQVPFYYVGKTPKREGHVVVDNQGNSYTFLILYREKQ